MERSVTYELETYDELPDRDLPASGRGGSPLEVQLQRIMEDPERHAPRWGRIGKYDSQSHGAAANSAANVLRKRHGETQAVEGWRFEVRRIEEGQATGLFVQYDPHVVEPGLKEQNAEKYEEWRDRQREKAKARAAANGD
jgi:hypothetical protein